MAIRDWFGRRARPAPAAAPVAPLAVARHQWEPAGPSAGRGRSVIPPSGRAYLMASQDRLVADFPSWTRSANADIRQGLAVMRARARHLAQNNDYAKSYLRALRRNVIGPTGMRLQMQVRREDRKLDSFANSKIEDAFSEWSMPATCSVTGKHARADLERLIVTLIARDGECLIYHLRGAAAGNKFGYSVQLLPIELLDETLNVPLGGPTGRVDQAPNTEIRMGVERAPGGRPVAYHLRTINYGDDLYAFPRDLRTSLRIPAADIVHAFRCDDPEQARGVTELHTAARRLQMLGGYEEAELTAARSAANKAGFYSRQDAETDAADIADEQSETDSEDNPGDFLDNAEAGHFQVLPRGYQFQPFDPQHPTQAFPDFVRQMLRGAGAGAGLSYASFANDLTQASYGSLRVGALEDRDEFRTWQDFMAGAVMRPIFAEWLGAALLTGAIDPLRPDREDRYRAAATWRGRGFSWIDPQKEATADELAVRMRIKSRSEICADHGRDFEDVLREQAEEQQLADKYKVTLEPPAPTPAAATAPVSTDATE